MTKPAMEPPPGKESNFDNPNRELYYICIASNTIAMSVCTIFVFLRLWARYRLAMRLRLDDMLRYGGGLHQWDVPEHLITQYNQTVYATMVNYGPTVFAIKAAILLFLASIFAPYKTYVKWIYGFLGVMGVYYVAMLFLKMFICRPISMFWGATTDGECFNQRVLILVDNIISLLSDIVVLLLPCPLTKKLQVGLVAKLKIVAIFGVGGIACIFSLVRLVFIIHNGESPDQTYVFLQINLTGDKPGYSSNYSRSQFEMMSSSKQRSRNTGHTPESVHYNEDMGSDENILIPNGKSYVTTNVRAGEGTAEGSTGSIGNGNGGHGVSLDDSHILRTVEVRQYLRQAS
ncbi:hypothetical protein J7337_011321 [Fusarium musae]|uniref:Rhodopsin domain-containing protein n=1 Tax=Fusarium musae TaxID=1042133 RepID=A0A9P8D730_9HYPO|nr:hypothetical protein J7337_011321 [Fusarium musae]KAG9496545.1 hypothetical protein J7337_011321 [Fusarium musae]